MVLICVFVWLETMDRHRAAFPYEIELELDDLPMQSPNFYQTGRDDF